MVSCQEWQESWNFIKMAASKFLWTYNERKGTKTVGKDCGTKGQQKIKGFAIRGFWFVDWIIDQKNNCL